MLILCSFLILYLCSSSIKRNKFFYNIFSYFTRIYVNIIMYFVFFKRHFNFIIYHFFYIFLRCMLC